MAKKTKAQEIAEFRAEVQNYIKTGASDILTAKEKANLDKVRGPVAGPGILDSIVSYFKK